MLRVGIVAGEHSGDQLGAGLMQALKQQCPDIRFEGILGPRMLAEGGHTLFPMDALAVMGLVEVVGRYLDLTYIRHQVKLHFLQNPPDVFIGIDAPDFNLGLETGLKRAGIKTVHYVSPSVWAWRKSRVHTVARAADRLLTLFPFEAACYRDTNLQVEFVGHPLADTIPLQTATHAAKAALGIATSKPVFAIMPGSRRAELQRHGMIFLQAFQWCQQQIPDVQGVIGLTDADASEFFQQQFGELAANLNIRIVTADSLTVMQAADVVLLASGTVALEAMLLKKPMVVAYKLAPVSFYILRRLVNIPWIALPNILQREQVVPEFLQDDVTPENLGRALLDWWQSPARRSELQKNFMALHQLLRCDTNSRAASAVLGLCQ
ncbi:MAG: lipid-A-disaccharide synthase [Gammaproteobacteria bacterium]